MTLAPDMGAPSGGRVGHGQTEGSLDVDEYPINVGRMLFTMVDPHRGSERADNRWYERDHYYAGCMIGPGWFAGSRWVATRTLKDLRTPEKSPVADPADAGSFLSIYWVLKDQEDPTWSSRQVQWLYANNRGFDQRTHVHTGIYDYASTAYRDDDGVPIELALDHHYAGLGVVMFEPRGRASQSEVIAWLDGQARTDLFVDGRVDMVSSWVPHVPDPNGGAPRVESAPGQKPAPGAPGGPSLGSDGGATNRVLQLIFIETDPIEAWERVRTYAAGIDAGGLGQSTFVAPFLRTKVGTDTYVDQIW